MLRRWFAFLLVTSIPCVALGSAEMLALRFAANGSAEVVLSGLTEFCNLPRIVDVDSVSSTGSAISINSIPPITGGGCATGTPFGLPYQVVANAGLLSPGTYTVTWTTSGFSTGPRTLLVTSILALAPNSAAAVPGLRLYGIAVLIASILVGGAYLTRAFERTPIVAASTSRRLRGAAQRGR